MKKTNKILLISLLSLVGLVGCGDNKNDGNKKDDPIIEVDPMVDHIEVTTMPTKVAYDELEVFDPTGMVITAVYDDGSTVVIPSTQYITRPTGPLPATTTSIRVIDRDSYEEVIVPITVNAGAPITSDPQLWVEAEKATMTFAKTELNCGNAYERNEDASNGVILKNFGKTGNTMSMKVNSTAAGKAKMVLKVCKRPKSSVSFANMYTVKVNDVVYPVDATLEAAASGDYFDLTEFSSPIYLNEGMNNVVLEALNDTGSNLDAFGFASDIATITDGGTVTTIQHRYAESSDGIYIVKEPSLVNEGSYSNGCTICGEGSTGTKVIPALSDANYSFVDGTYKITLDGHEFIFSPKYRFECEDMALAGTCNAGTNKGKPVSPENNVKTGVESASGNKCLIYMNTNGNTTTLVFNSSIATTATLKVAVAARINNKGVAFTVPFDEMYKTELNGAVLPNTNIDVVPSVGNNKPLSDSFEFHVITLGTVNIVEGTNTLVLTTVPRNDANHTMSAGNLDYVEFSDCSGAVLTAATVTE